MTSVFSRMKRILFKEHDPIPSQGQERNGSAAMHAQNGFGLRDLNPAVLLKGAARHVLMQGERPERIISTFTNIRHAMRRVRDRGVTVGTIIDVGASDGHWTEQALRIWPEARCHLIEANSAHAPSLRAFAETRPNVSYSVAAAGKTAGETLKFKASDDLYGGTLTSGDLRPDERYIEVPVTSLDHEMSERNLQGPFLVKLDTHGFETPILDGAREVLKQTNLAIIEVYVFPLAPESLRFHEMCSYMEDLGFRTIDFAEPLWRPYDKALWQFDLLFIKKDRLEFQYNRYR